MIRMIYSWQHTAATGFRLSLPPVKQNANIFEDLGFCQPLKELCDICDGCFVPQIPLFQLDLW